MIARLTVLIAILTAGSALASDIVPFADNGGLKMLYDNRMYPQAVEHGGKVFLVWRGFEGLPFVRSYDLESRTFGESRMLLDGLGIEIDARKYRRDHHYAPVIWTGGDGRLHVLFGCHGKAGVHLISKRPGDVGDWEIGAEIAPSISYPKLQRVAGGRTLVYYRHQGHLGEWRYRLSPDGGRSWDEPQTVIDMNGEPQVGDFASHAGSYNTVRVSADGQTLHVAFIWKMEEPLPNKRYGMTLHDHVRRHNLYYLRVELGTGKAFNQAGEEVRLPVTKAEADGRCLVWDTEERSAAVGPSIHLDEQEQPFLLLPVSGKTPYEGSYYLVRPVNGEWQRTEITRTSHPFNASYLERAPDGGLRAILVRGGSQTDSEQNDMDQYGWGDAVEVWVSDADGENWRRTADLTPVAGDKYQNVQFVSRDLEEPLDGLLLFYGWREPDAPGVGYLWDNR